MDVIRDSIVGFSRLFLFLLIIVCSGTQSALLCSQCTSGPNGSCVTSPPSATKCPHTTNNNVNCMITRKYSKNGTLIEFSRGCTMVRVGQGCVDQNNNITLCYMSCHTDNCNHTSSLTFSVLIVVVIFGISFLNVV